MIEKAALVQSGCQKLQRRLRRLYVVKEVFPNDRYRIGRLVRLGGAMTVCGQLTRSSWWVSQFRMWNPAQRKRMMELATPHPMVPPCRHCHLGTK